jgi:hypothetical protein
LSHSHVDLRRGQAGAAAGKITLHFAFCLEGALQVKSFGDKGAGGVDAAGVAQRVKAATFAFCILLSSFFLRRAIGGM